MRKFGPISVIISGAFTLTICVFVIFKLYGVINKNYVPPFFEKFIGTQILDKEKYCKIFFITIASISLLQIIIASISFKKIVFISMALIFLCIAIQIGFSVYHCVKLKAFSIYNIINLYILGISELGMLFSYFAKNKK